MKTFLEFVFFAAVIAGGAWVHPGLGLLSAGIIGVVAVNALDGES